MLELCTVRARALYFYALFCLLIQFIDLRMVHIDSSECSQGSPPSAKYCVQNLDPALDWTLSGECLRNEKKNDDL